MDPLTRSQLTGAGRPPTVPLASAYLAGGTAGTSRAAPPTRDWVRAKLRENPPFFFLLFFSCMVPHSAAFLWCPSTLLCRRPGLVYEIIHFNPCL